MRTALQVLSVIIFGLIAAALYFVYASRNELFYTYQPMSYFNYDQAIIVVGLFGGCLPRLGWLVLRSCI